MGLVVYHRSRRVKARGWLRLALLSLAVACVVAGASAFAAQVGDDKARAAALGAPSLMAPADDAVVNAVPGFSWRAVRGAAKYEFQFSADARFRSTLASFDTLNTSATVDKTVFDGNYYWRVRAVDANRSAGKWSPVRTVRKRWSTRPEIMEPAPDARITYPTVPLVLRWSPTPYAFKYEVVISADPTLAGNIVGNGGKPIETAATAVSVPAALSPGRYYWAVTPMDGGKLKGRRSEIGTFVWDWPSTTNARVNDLWGGNDSIVDPQFDWDAIPGAAKYDLEVNSSEDFAPGSKVCCADPTTGTSLAPTKPFPNNTYYWRVRARDIDGNAGVWNRGPDFVKFFVPGAPNLRLRDNVSDSLAAGSTTSSPVIAWDPVPGASSYDVQVVPVVGGGCNWSESALSSQRWDIATSSTAWTALGSMLTTPIDPAKPFERDFNKYEDGQPTARASEAAGPRTPPTSESSATGPGGRPRQRCLYLHREPARRPPARSSCRRATTRPIERLDHAADAALHVDAGGRRLPVRRRRVRRREPDQACRAGRNASADVCATSAHLPGRDDQLLLGVLPVKSPLRARQTHVTSSRPPRSRTTRARSRSARWLRCACRRLTAGTWRPSRCSAGPGMAPPPSRPPGTTGPGGHRPELRQPPGRREDGRHRVHQLDHLPGRRGAVLAGPGERRERPRPGVVEHRHVPPAPADPRAERGQPDSRREPPVLSWSPVPGAVSYDFHVEEEDGDKNDFTLKATAASFTTFHGLGVFRWQVRANFPKLLFGTVPSGWSPVQTFTRFIEPPPGARLTKDKKRLLLTWDPSPSAMHYRVDFSETNSFNQVIDSHRTDNPNYAPRMTNRALRTAARCIGGWPRWTRATTSAASPPARSGSRA